MARTAMASVSSWTQFDHTCLRRILVLFTSNAAVISVLNWTVWFGLFSASWKLLRDPLSQFAALLLLSLLPMYHNTYDMVAALPALAVFLRYSGILPAVLLTLGLATNPAAALARLNPGGHETYLARVLDAYYPLLILVILAGIYYVDSRSKFVEPLGSGRDPLNPSTAAKN